MAPTPAPASARSSLLRVPLVPLPDDAPLLGEHRANVIALSLRFETGSSGSTHLENEQKRKKLKQVDSTTTMTTTSASASALASQRGPGAQPRRPAAATTAARPSFVMHMLRRRRRRRRPRRVEAEASAAATTTRAGTLKRTPRRPPACLRAGGAPSPRRWPRPPGCGPAGGVSGSRVLRADEEAPSSRLGGGTGARAEAEGARAEAGGAGGAKRACRGGAGGRTRITSLLAPSAPPPRSSSLWTTCRRTRGSTGGGWLRSLTGEEFCFLSSLFFRFFSFHLETLFRSKTRKLKNSKN